MAIAYLPNHSKIMKGKVSQWEIIEVNFQMPDGRFLPHPALVVSNDELFYDEEFFYAVLMTTKNYFPKYTIEIKPEMLSKAASRQGYFATQYNWNVQHG